MFSQQLVGSRQEPGKGRSHAGMARVGWGHLASARAFAIVASDSFAALISPSARRYSDGNTLTKRERSHFANRERSPCELPLHHPTAFAPDFDSLIEPALTPLIAEFLPLLRLLRLGGASRYDRRADATLDRGDGCGHQLEVGHCLRHVILPGDTRALAR